MSATSSTGCSRKRSTRPDTRTSSPRSNRPASSSARWKARAAIVPERSRSSNARYGDPVRVNKRSLRKQANTPLTSCPGRNELTETNVESPASMPPCSTLSRMQPLEWEYRPDGLRAPALICAFKGWNDAADAASSVITFVAGALGGRRFATIDPEEFYDFQSTRPQVKLSDGHARKIVWPEVELYEARVPRAPRDLVLLVGHEPSFRWRSFSR